jgi:menaquinone-dependent protoporphyrinogen IX oxidase
MAEVLATALTAQGIAAEARPIEQGLDPAGYDAVVVGGPMIMGWHKETLRFLRRHQDRLATVPTAYFITAASLTASGEEQVDGVAVDADPWLAKTPVDAGKLSRKERYALPAHYLKKPFHAAPALRPRRVAFFAGCLDLTTMNVFEKLFVLLVVGATPGDGRHWDYVRQWAHTLAGDLGAPDARA